MRSPVPRRLALLAGATLLLLFAGAFVWEPWFRVWGTTPEERTATWPGDELVPGGGSGQVRAVTIQAPVDCVWPWLAQLGQDRGGFYSFDRLENLVGCRMPTVDGLTPERQRWRPGDRLWMYPPERAGGAGFATLRRIEPERMLVFGTRMIGTPLSAPENGVWGFHLRSIDSASTRLVVRGLGAPRALGWAFFDRLVFAPIHFVMERRMLLGVRALAEEGTRHRAENDLLLLVWGLTGLVMLRSAWRVVAGGRGLRPLGGFVASGIALQALLFLQPSPAAGTIAWVLTVIGVTACEGLAPRLKNASSPLPDRSSSER